MSAARRDSGQNIDHDDRRAERRSRSATPAYAEQRAHGWSAHRRGGAERRRARRSVCGRQRGESAQRSASAGSRAFSSLRLGRLSARVVPAPPGCCVIWLTASTAWVRELTSSARSTAATWSLTVSTDRLSSRAISLFGLPCSSRPSTSVWRGVRPIVSSDGCCAARAACGAARARWRMTAGTVSPSGAGGVAGRASSAARRCRPTSPCAAPRTASSFARAWARSPSRRGRWRGSRRSCGRTPTPRPPAAPGRSARNSTSTSKPLASPS